MRDNFYIILCGDEIFRNRGSYIVSMEIMMLMLLYFLAQNPDFPESVKPLMGKLKNSEEMLKFLNDLSRFSEMSSKSKGRKRTRRRLPRPLPKAKRRSLPHRRRPKKKKSRNPRPAELRTNLSSSASNDISKRSERRRP